MYCERYFDKQGNPIEMLEWAKLFEDFEYKVIQQTTLPSGKWVSTVWIGSCHNFNPLHNDNHLIFETMVFPKKGNYDCLDMKRYSTEEEALKGHEEMCKKYS